MAQVPAYFRADVQQEGTAPNDYQSVDVSPQAFGAGIGQALQGVGDQTKQAGSQVADTLEQYAQLRDETQATNVATNAVAAVNKAAGDFYAKTGQAAVDAYPAFQQTIQDARTAALNSATNPFMRAQIAQSLSGRFDYMMDSAARFNGDQTRVASVDASNGAIAEMGRTALIQRNDTAGLAKTLAGIAGEVDKQGQINGWDAGQTDAQSQAQIGKVMRGVISANLADGNIAQAQSLYSQYRNEMDAQTYSDLGKQLDEAGRSDTATAVVNGAIYNGPLTIAKTTQFNDFSNAVMLTESGGRQFAPNGQPLTSDKGAVGIMQVEPGTGPQAAQAAGLPWDPDRLNTDPTYNRALGNAYLQQNLQAFGGDYALAAAGYNAGTGAVQAAVRAAGPGASDDAIIARLPQQTQDYVRQIVVRLNPNAASGNGGPVDRDTLMNRITADAAAFGPDTYNAIIAKGTETVNRMDALNRQNQAEAQNAYMTTGQQLLNGQLVAIPEGRIRAAYPADQANEMINNLSVFQQVGQLAQAARFGTPAQRQQILADAANGTGLTLTAIRGKAGYLLGTSTPGEATDFGGADDKTKALAMRYLQQQITAQNQAIQSDPATYTMQDANVSKAWQAYQANPTSDNFTAYGRASLALQNQLGLAPNQQNLLPAGEAKGIVQRITQGDPAQIDIGAQTDQLAQTYGADWPQVYGQLVRAGLPPQYQTVAAMDMPTQAAARTDMVRAIQANGAGKGLEAAIGKGAAGQITTALANDATLQQFAQTAAVAGWSGNAATIANVRSSAQTLAEYYVMQGADPAVAAQRAVGSIIGAKYDFDGHLRVPPGSASQAYHTTLYLENTLTPDSLSPQYPRGNEVADARLRDLINAPKVWVMNSTDDGAIMTYRSVNTGALIPVMGKNNQPIGFKWADMPSMQQQVQSQADPTTYGVAP